MRATRHKSENAPDFIKKYVNYGGSIRAAQFIVLAAKARALSRRRYHVTYEDVTALAIPVLRHRILLNFHAESERMDADEILRRLIAHMPPPKGGAELQRFLDPAVLASISALDLLAKTVVDGFVAGLHRSPDFGFSQEFAEYRAYAPGRRPAPRGLEPVRAHRAQLPQALSRRDQQPTHRAAGRQQLHGVHAQRRRPKKMDYARFTAASLFYLAIHNQRDAAGLIVFDDEVRNYIRPSTRQGQLAPLAGRAGAGRTARPHGLRQAAAALSETAAPARHRDRDLRLLRGPGRRSCGPSSRCDSTATKWCCFTSSIRRRFGPMMSGPAVLVDLETDAAHGSDPGIREDDVPRRRSRPHRANCGIATRAAGMDYHLLAPISRSMRALREYLTHSPGEALMGFLASLVPRRPGRAGVPVYRASAAAPHDDASAGQLADVLRAGHAELHPASPAALLAAVRAAVCCCCCCWCWRLRIHSSGVRLAIRTAVCCWWCSTIPSACARHAPGRREAAGALQLLAATARSQKAQVMALGGQVRC